MFYFVPFVLSYLDYSSDCIPGDLQAPGATRWNPHAWIPWPQGSPASSAAIRSAPSPLCSIYLSNSYLQSQRLVAIRNHKFWLYPCRPAVTQTIRGLMPSEMTISVSVLGGLVPSWPTNSICYPRSLLPSGSIRPNRTMDNITKGQLKNNNNKNKQKQTNKTKQKTKKNQQQQQKNNF